MFFSRRLQGIDSSTTVCSLILTYTANSFHAHLSHSANDCFFCIDFFNLCVLYCAVCIDYFSYTIVVISFCGVANYIFFLSSIHFDRKQFHFLRRIQGSHYMETHGSKCIHSESDSTIYFSIYVKHRSVELGSELMSSFSVFDNRLLDVIFYIFDNTLL